MAPRRPHRGRHHAVLYIDGVLQGTSTGTISLADPSLDFGAGYIGGTWLDETHHAEDGNTGYLTYFNGQIADIALTPAGDPINPEG